MLDGFRINGETVWVDKGAEWHELLQLNLFLMKHDSCALHKTDIAAIVGSSMLSNKAVTAAAVTATVAVSVTLHHLALCTQLYSPSTNTLSICLLLDVFFNYTRGF